jgi:hypothetical protein
VAVEDVKRILSAAEQTLTEDEFAKCEKDEPSDFEYPLWYYLPEERQELLNMLVEEDSQRFVKCLVGRFRVFAKLIPVLNEVFPKRTRNA